MLMSSKIGKRIIEMISLKDVRGLTKYLDATSDQLLLGCTKPPIDLSGLTEDQIEEIFLYLLQI